MDYFRGTTNKLVVGAVVLGASMITPAQTTSATVLTADQAAVSGSQPYRAAVEAFFYNLEPKIVGGLPAAKDQFPWQVSLGVSWISDPYKAHFCGGSIYSTTWIITAAHCLQNTAAKDVIITAGTISLGKGGTRHNVRRIINKSNYQGSTHDNDIALVELFTPLKIGPAVKTISLVSLGEEGALLNKGAKLSVTGWGTTTEGGTTVRSLRFVEVPFVERSSCNRPLAYDGQITENMLCAGEVAGGKDSCQGDSGGPLTVNTSTKPALAGIVSFGEGCAKPNKVGVYTRVAKFNDWVKACTSNPAACP